MIHDQQRHAFHFRGRGETQDGFARSRRSDALEHPVLDAGLVRWTDHFERAFVFERFGSSTVLRFGDDLPRVLRQRAAAARIRRQQASLFIFERLHQRSAHGGFARSDRGKKRDR